VDVFPSDLCRRALVHKPFPPRGIRGLAGFRWAENEAARPGQEAIADIAQRLGEQGNTPGESGPANGIEGGDDTVGLKEGRSTAVRPVGQEDQGIEIFQWQPAGS
jgi:hypothetical protein